MSDHGVVKTCQRAHLVGNLYAYRNGPRSITINECPPSGASVRVGWAETMGGAMRIAQRYLKGRRDETRVRTADG
jgi:hypothetical protein